jgi:hypothetical protein
MAIVIPRRIDVRINRIDDVEKRDDASCSGFGRMT